MGCGERGAAGGLVLSSGGGVGCLGSFGIGGGRGSDAPASFIFSPEMKKMQNKNCISFDIINNII